MVIEKNKLNHNLYLIIIFVTFPVLLSYGGNNLSLEYKARSLTAAGAPLEERDTVILTFQAAAGTRYVGAVFAHENFLKLHLYTKNEAGLFYLLYPVPYGRTELKYRLVVDGVWMTDPSNSLSIHDYTEGVDFSIIELGYQREKDIINPLQEANGKISISFKGESGLRVSLIGDFNSWDPYAYPLQESADKPGYYTISFFVNPGRHYYLLLVNNKEIVDPYNLRRVYDKEAKLLNYFDFSP